jgi:hypothetical protein
MLCVYLQKNVTVTDRPKINLPEDRYFDPDPAQKDIALHLSGQKGVPVG